MKKVNIKFMFWYMRIGRGIYGALFALACIATFILLVGRISGIFTAILLDLTLTLMGVVLELNLMRCRERGTIYVETNKREDSFNLIEYHTKNENYFVAESGDEYVVKLAGEAYFKRYKKGEVILEENSVIDRPVLEVITSEKIAKPADNEYSIFALIGDKIKTESQRIIVKNKAADIRRDQEQRENTKS